MQQRRPNTTKKKKNQTQTRLPSGLRPALCMSLALGGKVSYSIPHTQCLISNSSPGPPLFLNDSCSKPCLQVLSSGPVVLMLYLPSPKSESWLSILSLCATVSLGRNSHPSSAFQGPSSLSQLCPDYLHAPGAWISQVSSTTFLETF